jgi:hypothetical protein
MIKSVWKPKSKKINGKKIINTYEMSEIDVLISKRKKGWTVVFNCDICKTDKTHSTTSHVFFNPNNKYNTLEHQICKSCRSKISEYVIKKNYIPFNDIKKSITDSDYKLLTNEEEYMVSGNRSQLKLKVVCTNNHNLTTTWNNWVKGKRCRKCYEDNKFENAVKNKNGWRRYKFLVWYYTEKTYKEFYHQINPHNYKRGKLFHLDHIYSIYDGFTNNVSPKIIGGVKNIRIISSQENLSKNKKSNITLNEIK